MTVITDIVQSFVQTDLVPKIVSETLKLNKKGKSEEEIVSEICSKNLDYIKTVTTTGSRQNTKPTAVVVEPVSLEDYIADHMEDPVCLYIFSRGAPKGKVCCRPLVEGTHSKTDDSQNRCEKHKNGAKGADIKSEIAKLKSATSSTEKVKSRASLPKGTPLALVSKSSTSRTPGLGSVKDRINASASARRATKRDISPSPENEPSVRSVSPSPTPEKKRTPVKSKERSISRARSVSPSPTPEKKRATPTKAKERSISRARSVSNTPETVRKTKERSMSTSSSVTSASHLKTPLKEKLEDFLPADDDGEHYYLTPSQPNATKYLWLLINESEVMVFDKDFEKCYGVLKQPKNIDPERTLRISSAWKTLLMEPNDVQADFVEDRGATYVKF